MVVRWKQVCDLVTAADCHGHDLVTAAVSIPLQPQRLRFERGAYGGCDQVVTEVDYCITKLQRDLVPSENHRENIPVLVLLFSLVRRSRR